MTKPLLWKTLAWGLILLAAPTMATTTYAQDGTGSARQPRTLPNIVIVFADDLGYGDVGVYNPESKIPTPRIDQMAREGILFTDGHSPATVCSPSRFGLLAGALVYRTGRGVRAFQGTGGPSYLEQGRLTIGDMLQSKGYTTAIYGKWHLGLTWKDSNGNTPARNDGQAGVTNIDYGKSTPIPDAPLHRGFNRSFVTPNCPTTDQLYVYIEGDRVPIPHAAVLDKSKLRRNKYTWDNDPGMTAPGYAFHRADLVFRDKTLDFIKNHRAKTPDKPFFVILSTQIAHSPAYTALEFVDSTKAGPQGDFIFTLDSIVGNLLDTLERLRIDENTLVIFTSDNGPETVQTIYMRDDYDHDSAYPWRGMKRDGWEGGHRVPFIARWPGMIPAGSVTDQMANVTDIMATVASVVGYTLPDDAAEDSYDLLPVLLGEQDENESVRPYNLTQSFRSEFQIRSGRWKLLDHKGSGGNNYDKKPTMKQYALPELDPDAPGQLYNLEEDPGETTNLYSKNPEKVKELKTLLRHAKNSGRSAPRGRTPYGYDYPARGEKKRGK